MIDFLKRLLKRQRSLFEKGGKLHRYYYAFEAMETFLFVPGHVTPTRGAHIRDAMDMKRMMATVVLAMLPCLLFGIWNTGHFHYMALGQSVGFFEEISIGLQVVMPIIAVSYGVGLGIEFLFATLKRHSVNEGFLVSGMLIPLVMPPTIPLWQVGLATAFSVVLCKEIFGGTGMNIFNVALMARAFLYFAYPSQISGDTVWIYLGEAGQQAQTIDTYSGATALAIAAEGVGEAARSVPVALAEGSWIQGMYSWTNLFIGVVPGSIGETSVLMCLLGAAILVFTRVGSGKIIFGVFLGAYVAGMLFNLIALNDFMRMPAHWHWVMGGLAFGAVFMATDPVTAAQTEQGKWLYGFLIGLITVVVRVINPAYPEGIMLAILLMNVFAALIDHRIVGMNKKRRLNRATIK